MQCFLKDGTVKDKKDFRPSEPTPMIDFVVLLKAELKTFMPHHDLAKWQDDHFDEACRTMTRNELLMVMDFGMNGNVVLRREAQSAFFMKVGYTMFPAVVLVDVRDIKVTSTSLLHSFQSPPPPLYFICFCVHFLASEFTSLCHARGTLPQESYFKDGEKAELLAFYEKMTANRGVVVPPRTRTSVLIIADDLTHDSAAVQHHTQLVVDEMTDIKEEEGDWSRMHVFSDGARSQFKNTHTFLWMSMFHVGLAVMWLTWNFFCSCHGKCWGDPEGGALKNLATVFNILGLESGNPTPRRSAKCVHAAAIDPINNFLRPSSKSFYLKKGRGIHSRIPVHVSKSDVNRKIGVGARLSDGELSSRLHQHMSTRVSQKIVARERSHYGCLHCEAKDWGNCPAIGRTGQAREMTTIAADRRTNPAFTRVQNARRAAADSQLLVGKFIAVECDGTVHLPSQPGLFNPGACGFFAADPFLLAVCTEVCVAGVASEGPHGKIKVGDLLLRVGLWRTVAPGSLSFRLLKGGHHDILVFRDDFVREVAASEHVELAARPTRGGRVSTPIRTLKQAARDELLTLVEGADHSAQRA
jgi:hypothetical protein